MLNSSALEYDTRMCWRQ